MRRCLICSLRYQHSGRMKSMSANLSSIYSEFNLNVVKGDEKKSYAFEDYRLDAARLMLYRGENEIQLPPKAVQTLLALVENHGAIVAKDDLISQLWADTVVEESNLSHYLYVLRKTLGNTADNKPFIETFRRRGYRFNGKVRVEANEIAAQKTEDADEIFKAKNSNKQQTDNLNSHLSRVERRGNVFALADWRETEKFSDDEKSAGERNAAREISIAPSGNPRVRYVFVIAVFAAVAFMTIAFVQFRSESNAAASSREKGDLTILRLTNGGEPRGATISPDGKYFVYHETDGATSRLWLQQTGQSNRLEIVPPTEKIICDTTFSPDGAFVYFAAYEKSDGFASLYRVPTHGGAADKILKDIASAISFSPDGEQIVFGRWNEKTRESALVIAASTSGNERILLAQSSEQGILGNPAWSPDGNLIAFRLTKAQNSTEGSIEIAAVNLQTNAIVSLSDEKWDTCYRIVWTTTGDGLIFVGTKAGDGYSTRRDQIYFLDYPSGEARRLTSDGSRYQLGSLGVTVKDEIIAVPFNRSSQIWQTNSNGDSRSAMQITNGLADGRAGLAPLADGRIAYITRMGDALNVWTANADGTNQKQLFTDPPFVEELRAASDGSFFVFSMQRGGRNHLFRTDADGENLQQMTFGESHEGDAAISPDGNWIVYGSETLDGAEWKSSLWKIPSAGGEPVLLTDTNCRAPHFSPDGKMLSCVYREREIYLVSAENGATLKSFEAVGVSTLNSGARFSPDGNSFVYPVHQKNISNLWQQPIDGAAARPLTDFTSGSIYNFAFSPDGARLYVARGNQINDAVLIKNFR